MAFTFVFWIFLGLGLEGGKSLRAVSFGVGGAETKNKGRF